MSLPYSFNKKIDFIYSKINQSKLIDKLYSIKAKHKIIEILNFENNVRIITRNSLINFSYEIVIKEDEEKKMYFEIYVINLFKISLLIIVFIPFFTNFSFDKILLFSSTFFVIFYFINLLYINAFVNKISKFIIEDIEPDAVYEEHISEEQKEWIQNKNKCSACGAKIENYYTHCFECGIKLDHKVKKSPFSTTKYVDYEIRYELKKTKK